MSPHECTSHGCLRAVVVMVRNLPWCLVDGRVASGGRL